MTETINFINKEKKSVIALSERFNILKKKKWDSFTYLLELNIQISHLNTIYNKEYAEKNRSINNLGDELSDILLQLICLMDEEHITFSKKDKIEYSNSDIEGFNILLGQLTEGMLEKYEYRFPKKHEDYNNIDDYIRNLLLKMFLLARNIARKNNLTLSIEFEKMLIDANNFIDRKIAA